MSIRNGMPAAELPEVTWRKSRRSGPQGGNCVEVANLPDGQVAVRNSRHPAGPCVHAAEWAPSSAAPGRRLRLCLRAGLPERGRAERWTRRPASALPRHLPVRAAGLPGKGDDRPR